MPDLIDFFLGRKMQRTVCSGIMLWVCYKLGVEFDTYLPAAIVVLSWVMEYLAWQDGVIQGAKGWDRMPEATRAKVRKLYDLLEKKDSND